MWKEEHEKLIADFVSQDNVRRLIVSVDNNQELRVSLSLTQDITGHIMYFVKSLHKPNVPQYIFKNYFIKFLISILIHFFNTLLTISLIQYGTININVVESLYNVLNGVYVPMLLENKNWPESMHFFFIK